jgi:hypothetical protein
MSWRSLLMVVAAALLALSSAWANDRPLRIKVLRSESTHVERPVANPPDCNWKDLSAYCYSSTPENGVENRMEVEQPDGSSLEISCTANGPSSQCAKLPVNQSFDAWKESRGLVIRYRGANGKMRKQLYRIVRRP